MRQICNVLQISPLVLSHALYNVCMCLCVQVCVRVCSQVVKIRETITSMELDISSRTALFRFFSMTLTFIFKVKILAFDLRILPSDRKSVICEYLENGESGWKMLRNDFIEVDIYHRMGSLRMLYSMTVT